MKPSGWYARLQAWLMATLGERHSRLVADRKERLIGSLRGRVVEIGPGGGVNLGFYAAALVSWEGVEPNAFAHPRLREAAARHGIGVAIHHAGAERLPFDDGSVDAVVSTLVLCSVRDPHAALREIRRVLRPGGRFVFVEHVVAPDASLLRVVQRAIRPAWRVGGGGCEPDRDIGRIIRESGFARVQIEHFRVPLPVVSPHVAGWAER